PVLSCGSADEQSRNVLNSLVCVQPSARRWRHLLRYCIRGSRFYTDRVLLFFFSQSFSTSVVSRISQASVLEPSPSTAPVECLRACAGRNRGLCLALQCGSCGGN